MLVLRRNTFPYAELAAECQEISGGYSPSADKLSDDIWLGE